MSRPAAEPSESPRVPWQGSNAALVEQLRRGSEAAAAIVYDRFARDVDRVVWLMLGADSEHDDLVNETFLAAFRDIDQLRDVERLRSWIYGIAVNTVRQELRRRGMRRRFFRAHREAEQFSAICADPDTRRLLAQAFSLLDRLPASERAAFTLRHIDGRSLQECAELCGCSLATLKRWLAKAERRFKKMARHMPEVRDRLEQSRRWEAR